MRDYVGESENEYDNSEFARIEVQNQYENQFLNAPLILRLIFQIISDVLCKLKMETLLDPDGLIDEYTEKLYCLDLKVVYKIGLMAGCGLCKKIPEQL